MIDFKKNFDVLEKIVINYILDTTNNFNITDDNNRVIDRIKLVKAINKKFFKEPVLIRIFDIIKNHVTEFNKIPSTNEIWSIISINNIDVDREEFDVVLSYDLSTHNKRILYKYIKAFLLILNLNQGLMEMMSHLKTIDVDFDNIDSIYEYIRSHLNKVMQVDITDTGDGLDFFDPDSHIQTPKSAKGTGFAFFDKMLGGWEKKTLNVFMARPKQGKCAFGATTITVKNKITNQIETITIEEFYNKINNNS